MKTIVVGTDFSASSKNATLYAAMLASSCNCKLILFNLIEVSWMHANSGLFLVETANNKHEHEQKIKRQLADLKILYPKLEVSYYVQEGSFKRGIKKFIETHEVKMVVMGLQEKNKFYKSVYGSHGVDIAGKLNAPVIIVPQQYKNHSVNHVLLAVDNTEKIYKTSLKGFEGFLKETKCSLDMVHFRSEEEVFTPKSKVIKLNKAQYKIEEIPAIS